MRQPPTYYAAGLLRQANAALARNYLQIPPSGGAVNFSAGTTSNTFSAVTFGNANGVTFGLDAVLGVITASVGAAGGGLTNIKVSAGTLSQNRSDITFANGSGVTFGLNAGGIITASVQTNYQSPGAYLTTAMQSGASTQFVQANAAFAGTNASGTIASSGISVSVAAPGMLSFKLSAGTLSQARTDVTFADSNGVSFGLSGNGVITASVATNYQSPGAYLTTAMQSGASTQFVQANAAFAGTNASGTIASSGISVSVGTAITAFPRLDQVLDPNTDKNFSMGSNQLQLSWNTGGSFSTNATRQGMFELDFQGNLTLEADLAHFHIHGGAPNTMDILHIEGDGANETGLRLQMSASVAAEVNMPIKFTTRDTGFSVGSVPFILGSGMSNSVTFLNADFVDGRDGSVLAGTGFTTATTAGANLVGTLGTNGISLGVPKWLTTAAAAAVVQSYWQNLPGPVIFATNVLWSSNTSYCFPVILPYAMSWDFARFWGTFGSGANATFATSNVNQTFSGAYFSTINCVLYSLGSSNSSESLMSVTSFSAGMTQKFGVTEQSNQYTQGTSFTYPYRDTSNANTGIQRSLTTTNIAGGSTASYSSGFFGNKWLDIPAGFSVPAGAYWLAVGIAQASSSNVVSNLLQNSAPFSFLHISQWNAGANNLGELGQAQNSSGGGQLMLGLGALTTNTSGTLAAFDLSALVTQASYMIPFLQVIGAGIV